MKWFVILMALTAATVTAHADCAIVSNGQVTVVVKGLNSYTAIGVAKDTLRLVSPMDEYKDYDNLIINPNGVYDGSEAFLKPKEKVVYSGSGQGQNLILLQKGQIVTAVTGVAIGQVKPLAGGSACSSNQALLGGYTLFKMLAHQ